MSWRNLIKHFIPITFVIGITVVQRILLISLFLLVLIVELINTVIETVVNLISTEYHELSGRAKDMSSAAVLIAAINSIVVWLLIVIANFLCNYHSEMIYLTSE